MLAQAVPNSCSISRQLRLVGPVLFQSLVLTQGIAVWSDVCPAPPLVDLRELPRRNPSGRYPQSCWFHTPLVPIPENHQQADGTPGHRTAVSALLVPWTPQARWEHHIASLSHHHCRQPIGSPRTQAIIFNGRPAVKSNVCRRPLDPVKAAAGWDAPCGSSSTPESEHERPRPALQVLRRVPCRRKLVESVSPISSRPAGHTHRAARARGHDGAESPPPSTGPAATPVGEQLPDTPLTDPFE